MRIHILAFLLFCQSFVACQQVQDKTQLLEANIGSPSITACQQAPEKAPPSATDLIFQSTDGGQTWQDISAGLPKDLGIGRVLVDGGEVFLTSAHGLYHSRTAFVAPVWEKEFFLNEISNVFPGRSGLYVSSYRTGFFQKMPGMDIWASMHNSLKDKTVRAILETPSGTILVGNESGIFKSTDGAKTWKQVFEGEANSFAMAGDVLICGALKGILRSTDGGEHWDAVLTGDGGAYGTKLLGDRFVALTDGNIPWNDIPEGTLTNRLYTSADNGKTWQRIDKSLASARLLIGMNEDLSAATWSINDIVQAGEYLFCSLDTGIFRSSNWGKTWELVFPANGKKSLNLTASGKVIYAVKVMGC